MAAKEFPKLGRTIRFYVEDTIRVRLRSPGIERYRPTRSATDVRRAAVVALTLAAGAALVWVFALS